MPHIDGVVTKESKSIWRSPDGQREIFEVQLEYKGQVFKAKTYSKDISALGWTGTVESYEKEGRNGSETFVKQPPKEDGVYQGGRSYGGGGSKPAYQPKDEAAIKAMWAIGQSVAAHNGQATLDVADLPSVEAYALELFGMVDRVKAGNGFTATDSPVADEVHEVSDEPLDLSHLDEVLGATKPADPGETPWNRR